MIMINTITNYLTHNWITLLLGVIAFIAISVRDVHIQKSIAKLSDKLESDRSAKLALFQDKMRLYQETITPFGKTLDILFARRKSFTEYIHLTFLSLSSFGYPTDSIELQERQANAFAYFTHENMKSWCLLKIFAPKNVLDAYTNVADYVLNISICKAEHRQKIFTQKMNNYLEAIRADLGIDSAQNNLLVEPDTDSEVPQKEFVH